MVVLFLLVLWVAVLAPPLVVKIRDRRTGESIDSFHRQLHLLERTGHKSVAPAFRLATADAVGVSSAGSSGYPTVSSMPGRPQLALLGATESSGDGVPRPITTVSAPRLSLHPPAPPVPQERDRRQTLRRRRRDLLFALLGVATVSGLLGMIPSLRFLWVVTALSVIALVGYLALVVYAEQLRTEQQRLARMRRETAPPVTTPFLDQDYWEDDEPEPARAAAGR